MTEKIDKMNQNGKTDRKKGTIWKQEGRKGKEKMSRGGGVNA